MILLLFVALPFGLFALLLVIFVILQKTKRNNKSAVLQKMINSSTPKGKSMAVFYQNVYTKLDMLPFINRYLRKIRRRMELINEDDEYLIRQDTARIALKCITLLLLALLVIGWINKENLFIMLVSFLGVFVVIENLTEQMINKVENRLLEQELEFFSEVRHAFHSTSMVEEAIYDATLMDEQEIVSQANTIYNIMVSADPEMELEKYYDVAPNKFLKIFAGVSYLTKEFGDRKVNGVSLYLKDMNNITQELQLEILKRDKLNYLFTSLTYIAIAPIVMIYPLKNWAMNNFASTSKFYEGKLGFIFEVLIIAMIFLSYSLIVRIKDNVDSKSKYSTSEAWQERVYRLPFVERIVDALIPNQDKPEYAGVNRLLKDTASTLRIEWLYVNKVISAVVAFLIILVLIVQTHEIAERSILEDSFANSGVMGKMSKKELDELKKMSDEDKFYITQLLDLSEIRKAIKTKDKNEAINVIQRQIIRINAMEMTDNVASKYADMIINKFPNSSARRVQNRSELENAILSSGLRMHSKTFVSDLANSIIQNTRADNKSKVEKKHIMAGLKEIYSVELTVEEIQTSAARIYDKVSALESEYFKWTELLIAIFVAVFAYYIPNLFLLFQKKMRKMEMDDEVMQFQTIILMLMYIERVSVEYILEWLTRFSNIFREPLQRCLNNYESGAYEALEELKDEVTFKPFIRIVESLQSAIENVKITDAFDELESERAFFQEKRKESNERLINRKAKIGKLLGFAPMVTLFIGYLIAPMIASSIGDMNVYFEQMGSML